MVCDMDKMYLYGKTNKQICKAFDICIDKENMNCENCRVNDLLDMFRAKTKLCFEDETFTITLPGKIQPIEIKGKINL